MSGNNRKTSYIFSVLIFCAPLFFLLTFGHQAWGEGSFPKREIYRDVNEVALFVYMPDTLENALKCHGVEEECAEKQIGAILELRPSEKESYIQELKRLYSVYPVPLRYTTVKEQLRTYIENNILPKVVPEQKKVVILDAGKGLEEYAKKKNVLIITALHDLIDDTEPNIMSLQVSIYRPDMKYIPPSEYVFMSPRGIITIPLNLPDQEIENRFKIAISRYLQVY